MEKPNDALEAAMARVLGQQVDVDAHVSPQDLVSYRHDLLSAERQDAVQEHLAACRDCAELYLDLEAFEDDAVGDETLASDWATANLEDESRVDDDWQQLAQSLRDSDESARQASDPQANNPQATVPQATVPQATVPQATVPKANVPKANVETPPFPHDLPPPSRPASTYLPVALAASLLLAVTFGSWVVVLKSEVESLRRPQVNIPVVSLYPPSFSRGGAHESTVRGAQDRFVVILNSAQFPNDVGHQVRILRADGREVMSLSGLRPTAAGNFHLELSRHILTTGRYTLLLSENENLLAELPLEIAD